MVATVAIVSPGWDTPACLPCFSPGWNMPAVFLFCSYCSYCFSRLSPNCCVPPMAPTAAMAPPSNCFSGLCEAISSWPISTAAVSCPRARAPHGHPRRKPGSRQPAAMSWLRKKTAPAAEAGRQLKRRHTPITSEEEKPEECQKNVLKACRRLHRPIPPWPLPPGTEGYFREDMVACWGCGLGGSRGGGGEVC